MMEIVFDDQTEELRALDIKQIKSIKATNVLILSAHSGDEVFACGGLIAHLAESAKHIKVVYFSDKLDFDKTEKSSAEEMRQQEAEGMNGLRVLGIHEASFLRLKEISIHSNIAIKILEELKGREWDLVILPQKDDWSLDHRVIYSSCQTALKFKLPYIPKLLQYCLFGIDKPDAVFAVDKYMGEKEEAARCHKSILKQRDMASAALGMENYLGGITGLGRGAEGYMLSTN